MLLIWGLVAALIKEAVERIMGEPEPINAKAMLPLAVCGLLVNVLYVFLRSGWILGKNSTDGLS